MPDIPQLDASARRLRELHQIGRQLLMVNVWDPASAQAVVAAGSPAVATSSVTMAATRGGSDSNRDREAA
jgi:2-methylisocitrate lyase-like PEP mutase family enzyme